jgi:competence protein ComEC
MPRSFGLACGALLVALIAATMPPLLVPAAIAASVAAVVAPRRTSRGRTSVWPFAVGVALVAARVLLGPGGAGIAGAHAAVDPGSAAAGTLRAPNEEWSGEVRSIVRRAGGRQVALVDVTGNGLAYVRLPRFPEFATGDRLQVEGPLEPLPADPAPERAGWIAYLERVGVDATVEATSAIPVGHRDDPATWLASTRDAAGDALGAALPEPEAGLAAGILVGLRERVDPGLARDFTAAGLTHVVAISGWNIAIVGGVCSALVRPLRRRSRAIVVAAVIAGYTVFAGASPSVVRAALMAAVALISREGGRRAGATRALAIAVAVMLVADPAAVADPGFQLSACATLGLIAWATPLDAALARRSSRLPGPLRESLAVSLSAQAATLPIVLLDFGRLSLISPLANLVAAPLVPFAMAAAAAALPLGILAQAGLPPAATGIPLALVALPIQMLVAVARSAAAVPFASVQLATPVAVGAAALAAVGIVAIVRTRSAHAGAALRASTL